MKVRVKLFAGAKQAAGSDTIEIVLPAGATVAQLRDELARRAPALDALLPQLMFAVDKQYADDTVEIQQNAEVACIPPVSGG